MRSRWRLRPLPALLLLALLGACRDGELLPTKARPRDEPEQTFSRVVEGTPVELGTHPLALHVQWARSDSLPVTLPPGRTRLRVRVEGGFTFRAPDGGYCRDPLLGIPPPSGPLGWQSPSLSIGRNMEVELWVAYPSGRFRMLRPVAVSADSMTVVYEGEISAPGTLRWSRAALLGCHGDLASAVSGEQRATVYAVPLVEAPDARVELVCQGDRGRNEVTRGEEITCQARKEPGDAPGELAVTGWTSDGKPREDGDPASTTWSGVMVRGGTVAVTARIGGGAPQTAEAAITVHDRDWSGKQPTITVLEVEPSDPRVSRIRLPPVPEWAEDLGFVQFFPWHEDPTSPQVDDPLEFVSGGPNDGLVYFGDVAFQINAVYVLNRTAMAPGSDWARMHDPDASHTRPTMGTHWCPQSSIPRMLEAVRQHEETHVRFYRANFIHLLSTRWREFEKAAGTDPEALSTQYRQAVKEWSEESEQHSESVVDAPNGPYVTRVSDAHGSCVLRNDEGELLRNRLRG